MFSSRIKKAVVAFSIAAVVITGLAYTPDYFEISKNLDIFNAVYRELNVSYVDGTKPGELMKKGIDAMLGSLDPYTNYYTENDIEDFRYMTTGEYGGIGAVVQDIDGKITIAEPYEGFAADKAGLKAGDQILGVNGINVGDKKTEDISSLLKGTAGTEVKMTVLKAGQTKPVDISIVREEIKNKAVPYYSMLPNSETGYIKLVAFTENCSGEVKTALNELKSKNCKSLILDLRGNLGGLLHEAVNIVNFFIDKGQEVVFTKGKMSDWDKSYLSVNNPIDTEIPLIVLVDENSASASEIVSGALQDLDRAVIIGKRTYGKGLVQQTKPLVYNAQIKVTVAKYYIPSGRCVQALDYSHRDEDGRVEKVSDSLVTAFKTKGGRIVYDGAGVMPDVKTEEEKFNNILISLVSKNHVFNYATQYVLNHANLASVKDFSLSEAEYSDFVNYLKDKDYSYKTQSELNLEELKKTAEDETYFSDIKTEYDALVTKMNNNKKDDLLRHKTEIKKYLEEEIVQRYYYQKGRIEFSLKSDEDIKQALSIFTENKLKTILTTIEKPTKPFNAKKKF
ncbi:MAG: S41 family peptidase [Bacteroidetes bacterium]|nr:S41 family peptidase [Bacteroidota bacterium]